jgi:hypothetical protein
MEELLKSSRLIQYTLIALSAGILLLALSPNRPLQHRKAVRQIEMLKQVQFEKYLTICLDVKKKAEATHAAAIVSELTKNQKFRFMDDFRVWYPVYCSWPTSSSSLSEIRDFFESQNEVLVVMVAHLVEGPVTDTPKGMISMFENHQNLFPKGAEIRSVEIKAPCLKQSGKSKIVGILEQPPPGDLPCDGTIDVTAREPLRWGPGATICCSEGHQKIENVTLVTMHYVGRLAMDWLKPQKLTYDELVTNTGFLSEVLPFWNQVSTLAPQAALLKLADQSPPNRTLSVIGLEIDEDIAIWVCPVVLLFVLLFLLAHLDTIRATIDRQTEDPPTIFWIATMPSSLGGAMTYVSLTLLPSTALGVFLFRSPSFNERVYVGLALSLLVLLAGVACCVRIWQIRARAKVIGTTR